MSKTLNHLCFALAVLCLLPAGLSAKDRDRGCERDRWRDCQSVPEGGSAAVYVLGAGAICVAAIAIRSRSSKQGIS